MKEKMSDNQLLHILKEWIVENGRIPSKREFCADENTPSDMPYRKAFGSWGNAIRSLGYEPLKPKISELAAENSIKTRKGKQSPNFKGGRRKISKDILNCGCLIILMQMERVMSLNIDT